ncbi:MAG TPA: hypothetical protein VJ754_00990 [Anaerolineae bacterium]|nr:hypothetical protein [Anaerolineae bacterium]
MPVSFRNKLILKGGLQLADDGLVSREIYIPYQDVFIAGCPVMAGSIAMNNIGAGSSPSLQALRFTGTKCTCPITLVMPVPIDAATGVVWSSSGTVYVDWTDMTTATAAAVVGASLYLIPNGSAIGDAGTSTLGAAASGTTITGTSASELNSASLFSFTAPATRAGFFALKTIVDSVDAGNTSGSNFNLFGLRIKYNSDRIGT